MSVSGTAAGRAMLLGAVLLLLFFSVDCALGADPATVLENIRIGAHHDFDRIVFDLKGAQPSRVNVLTDEGVVIEFKDLQPAVRPEQVASRLPSCISGMTFQKEKDLFQIKITFRAKGVSVDRQFIPPSPSDKGPYRLVLDFKPEHSTPDKADEKATSTANLKNEKAKQNTDSSNTSAVTSADDSGDESAAPIVVTDPKIDELYRIADETFAEHKDDLAHHAGQIIQQYLAAIKAGPKAPQVAQALYRCGATYLAVLDYRKAEECFKRVIADHPDYPSIGSAWMGIAKIHDMKRSYPEAVLAYRTALDNPIAKDDRLEALYSLGRVLSHINSPTEAMEMLTRCMIEDPKYYLKKPDLLRVLGEAMFATGQYDKSSGYLLWYLNLRKDVLDHDLVLARLAEALAQQDQRGLADGLYAFIKQSYPDSDGEAIGAIRSAELLEQQGQQGEDKALEIYKSLSQKTLSPSLSRLVIYKLASWEWRHQNFERSLILIDAVLSNKNDSTAFDECKALKEQVILAWAKQAYAEKNYMKVMELFRGNEALFKSRNSPELTAAVAESFGEAKAYPKAIEMYQSLLSETNPKSEEWIYKTARYYFLMGDTERAVQTSAQLQSDAYLGPKTELLAKIYFAQGKYKDAVQNFDKLFNKGTVAGTGDAESVLQYAESLLNLGRYQEGVSWAVNGSKHLSGADAEQQVQLTLLRSKCHEKLGQQQKAIEALEEALPLVQSETLRDRLNYQLAGLYAAVKDFKKAKEKLTQLSNSSQPFWKVAAQQQLSYIQMQQPQSKASSF